MGSATIRPAKATDVAALTRLKRETFRETFVNGGFRIPYPPADLAIFMERAYSPEKIAAELADPDERTWIAVQDGAPIGYARVGPCHLPHPEASANQGELYQLYLRGSAQGLGLGGKLMALALDHLAATMPGPVWLGVWSGNVKAQEIYLRQGFRKVGEYRFPVGNWLDDEFIFRKD